MMGDLTTNYNNPVNINLDATKVLDSLYVEAFSPGMKKVGQALETIFELCNTILLPIKLVNTRAQIIFKKSMDSYIKKMEEVPEDHIVPVPPELGVQIVDKFTYITDDDIREMYVNLLFSASKQDTLSLAHPSSLRILEALSPDEAKILNHIKKETNIPFIRTEYKYANDKGYKTVDKYLTGIEQQLVLAFPENMSLYIDNLLSCGAYQYEPGTILTNSDIYNRIELEYKDVIDKLKESLVKNESNTEIIIEHGLISDRTPFYRPVCNGEFALTL